MGENDETVSTNLHSIPAAAGSERARSRSWMHGRIVPHELAEGLALKGEFMRTAPAAQSRRGQNATNRSRGRVVWCAWRGVLWGRG